MNSFAEITETTGLAVRTALNENFEDLYEGYGGGCVQKLAFSGGTTAPTPSATDPSLITTITHAFGVTYGTTPYVVPIPKCDWSIYVVSVSTTGCVIGCGSTGSATTLNYDLLVIYPPSAITLT